MGKKYIIELLDECNSEFKGIMVFGLTQEKQISVELIPEESMTPYTEPDLEQIRKEAWEAARTLWNTPKRKEIFGYTSFNTAFMTLTAQEVIEKIRAYEQAQEKIQVGDEVEAVAGKAVIIEVIGNGKDVRYMYPDASTGFNESCNVTRTGRHFPEIAEVLQKMKES